MSVGKDYKLPERRAPHYKSTAETEYLVTFAIVFLVGCMTGAMTALLVLS